MLRHLIMLATQAGQSLFFLTQDAEMNVFQCSGSLIEDNRVLTNNHCIENDEEGRLARHLNFAFTLKTPMMPKKFQPVLPGHRYRR